MYSTKDTKIGVFSTVFIRHSAPNAEVRIFVVNRTVFLFSLGINLAENIKNNYFL